MADGDRLAIVTGHSAGVGVAGMAQVAEWELADDVRCNAALLTYEPGVVDTAMQRVASEASRHKFPSQPAFAGFYEQSQLQPPSVVVGPIVAFLASDEVSGYCTQRYGW